MLNYYILLTITIIINHYQQQWHFSESCSVSDSEEYKQTEYVFSLATPRRTFFLSASSHEDKMAWVNSVCRASLHDKYSKTIDIQRPFSNRSAALLVTRQTGLSSHFRIISIFRPPLLSHLYPPPYFLTPVVKSSSRYGLRLSTCF